MIDRSKIDHPAVDRSPQDGPEIGSPMTRTAPFPSRRAVLGGAAALAAWPLAGAGRALGQTSGDVDAIIIGAGAAGISAARRMAEAGRSYVLLEAGRGVGGRARTDTATFGVPVDMGGDRLFLPGGEPVADAARREGLTLTPTPSAARLYLSGKEAGDTEYEDFVAAIRRGERAIGAAGDAARDLPASRVLPDLGPWSATAAFALGPFTCAKDLDQVSTVDFSRAEEREGALLHREGMGPLMARLAQRLTVRLETAATSVEIGARAVQVGTTRGTVSGRTVILAIPPSLIAAGKLRLQPNLPARYRTAVERITLGAYERIAFALPGNPLSLEPNELVHVKADGRRAFALIARRGGSDVYSLEVGGAFARELVEGPAGGPAAFVKEALAAQFGSAVAAKVGKVEASRWIRDPLALGSFSCALPGAGNMRRAFTEVVNGRLLFAGEHAHETLWGTLAGAWLSGERAANQALRIVGAGTRAGQ